MIEITKFRSVIFYNIRKITDKEGSKREEKQPVSDIVELDVRKMLRNKQEHFQLIMDTVNSLNPNDRFVLHATFEPIPLLNVMNKKGFNNKVDHVDKEHWVVTFTKMGRNEHEIG